MIVNEGRDRHQTASLLGFLADNQLMGKGDRPSARVIEENAMLKLRGLMRRVTYLRHRRLVELLQL
ncbi:MAG: hypothetical protein KME27_20550 [Lyngbya sp. HA4199-MV5]|nr:hypothetical protein [Lyngbya sp. HA4199-MV5]